MTQRTIPPFRADHVGSFLRPKELLDAREQCQSGAISKTALRQVEDRAIRDVVKFQEDLGLVGITDGEFRRTFFHIDFLEQLEDFNYLKSVTRRVPKVTIPSPTMLHFRGGRGAISKDAYPDMQGFYADVAQSAIPSCARARARAATTRTSFPACTRA